MAMNGSLVSSMLKDVYLKHQQEIGEDTRELEDTVGGKSMMFVYVVLLLYTV